MLKKLHMLQNRSPYVAHMQPICGPYVSAAVVVANDTGGVAYVFRVFFGCLSCLPIV